MAKKKSKGNGRSTVEHLPSPPEPEIEPELERVIAETAYFIAEQRGFNGGDAVTDWLEAERMVRARYGG